MLQSEFTQIVANEGCVDIVHVNKMLEKRGAQPERFHIPKNELRLCSFAGANSTLVIAMVVAMMLRQVAH